MDRKREWIGVFPELVSNRRKADTAPKAEPGITGCGTPVGGMGELWIAGDERQEANRNERYRKKYEIGKAGEGALLYYGDKDPILKDFRWKRERERKRDNWDGMRGEEPKTSPSGMEAGKRRRPRVWCLLVFRRARLTKHKLFSTHPWRMFYGRL